MKYVRQAFEFSLVGLMLLVEGALILHQKREVDVQRRERRLAPHAERVV